jgi:centromere protein I
MGLTRQAGNEPPLVGLMRVFKDYYPDVIVGEVTSGRASVFTVGNILTYEGPANAFSTQIKSGGSDLAKFKRSTFREHRTVCRLNNVLSGLIEEGQARPRPPLYQKCTLHMLKR